MIRFLSLLSTLLIVGTSSAQADSFRIRTALSGTGVQAAADSVDTALGFGTRSTTSGSVRLMWDKGFGDFQAQLHSHLAFAKGGDVAFANALAPAAPPPSTLFDLSHTLLADSDTLVTNTIDRFWISYSSPSFFAKVGRQAITWGSGLVFHPADIVAPFSPSAIDTSYKPGADMVYLQYLFESGADIQAIAVPRAEAMGGPIAFSNSTYAIRGRNTFGQIDASLMFARDRGDSVASVSLSGPLGGASWNAEVVGWELASGERFPSWVANISNFSSIGEVNVSYFAEVFHNGFGVAPSTAVADLPASLTKRMANGQVFYAGTNFLALGAQFQLSPDLMVAPNTIVSMADQSSLSTLAINYTIDDNTNIVFSYFHPIGASGTDFGGRETASGSGVYTGIPKAVGLQLVHFK